MPKVELKLNALSNISYTPTKIVEFDDDSWGDASLSERQDMIDEEARQFRDEDIDWDYRVIH